VCESLLFHVQVFHYKLQVGIDLVEMVDFSLHLHTLSLELLQFILQWVYVPLKLFNFVVQHKLKLF